MKKKPYRKNKKGPTMRTITMSQSNMNAAIESFLYSLRMIDGDERVNCVVIVQGDNPYQITLERQEEYN